MIKYLLILISIFSFCKSYSQDLELTVLDSLKNDSYWKLQNKIYSSLEENSVDLARLYAKSYLARALSEKDSLYIAEGYLFLSATMKDEKLQNNYLDLSIKYSKNINDWLVPCMAYSIKGGLFDDKNEYKKSLDYYFLAHDSAKKGGNSALVYQMKENIGITKSRIGDYEGALKYSRETWNHVKNKKVDDSYLNNVFSMSYVHAFLKNIDSSKFYKNLGIEKTKALNENYHLNRFIFLEGIISFYESKYRKCINNIEQSSKKFKEEQDILGITASYYFLGCSHSKLNNKETAKKYLIKMDSTFSSSNLLIPYCRKGYKILIDYYKSDRNIEKQLFYTNRLLRMDSIINSNYKSLSTTIYKNFETRELIKDRELLINELKYKDSKNLKYIYTLLIFALTISISLIYNYHKRKRDNMKFKKILEKASIKSVEEEKTTNNKLKDNIDLDEDLINNILIKLNRFEEKKEFLNPNISLAYLSKKFKTNSRYLSKIINHSQKKTLPYYINDLRINYVIDRLKEDSSFRKYSVEAIGKEVGFKTSRAFSEAFRKKTGLKPSYFIAKISKNN